MVRDQEYRLQDVNYISKRGIKRYHQGNGVRRRPVLYLDI
jgi:hypothetical protein